MIRRKRDIGHEISDRLAALSRRVRCAERGTYAGRKRRPGQPRGAAYEGPRTDADHVVKQATPGQSDQERSWGVGRKRYAGVGQDHPRDPILMTLGPAERDRSAPIVRRDDDPASDAYGSSDGLDVIDPFGQSSRAIEPLGVAHSELVDRDHAPTGLGAGQESTPQIRPRGVAVYAEQCPLRRRHPVVENVPGTRNSVLIDYCNLAGPGRVQARHRTELDARRGSDEQRLGHQTISAKEVLRPEPIPIRRTRSWARSWSMCRARVNGTAAGPMF